MPPELPSLKNVVARRVASIRTNRLNALTPKPKNPNIHRRFFRSVIMESRCRTSRIPARWTRLLLAWCCAGTALSGLANQAALSVSSTASRFGQIPLMFEPAATSEHGASTYLARGPGYQVALAPDRLQILLRSTDSLPARHVVNGPAEPGTPSPLPPRRRGFGMELVGGDPKAAAVTEMELPTRVNYFLGADPNAWQTGITTHGRVRYAGVYPGIDLVYYGNQRRLEHDFVIAPGMDPARIRWRFTGIDRLEPQPDGALWVMVDSATFCFEPPQAYQSADDQRQPVPVAYRIEPGPEIGFAVGWYDPTRPLVIDPVLAYSTYLGGLGYEQASGVAVNASGEVYVVGETSSTNFPVANALWPTNGGGYAGSQNPYGNEAFVAKLSAEGTNLLFATYLGGNGLDVAVAIALDNSGNPVITGLTASTNFPITPDALQSVLAGEPNLSFYYNDIFATRLSANGDALLYSTFIGGTNDDLGLAIAIDSANALYLAGHTESRDFPVRNSPYEFQGDTDAFVLKFTPGDADLTYSMVLGGNDFDFAQSLAVDSLGHAYVAGNTGSSAFPVTNAFQAEYRGGSYDAFVARVAPAGDRLLFSSYLGSSSQDEALGIALDPDANAYVTGFTQSSSFPVTNALYATKGSGKDAFVTKFNSSGQILYSTFLGGRSDDEGWAIAVDSTASVHVAGMTQSSDFPLTNQLQSAYQGNRDMFITKFRPDGQSLNYSTFLGGSRADEARALALDSSGNAYVVGYSSSTDFPVLAVSNPIQRFNGGGVADAFVVKIVPDLEVEVVQPSPGVLVFSWPASAIGYSLESSPDLLGTNAWSLVSGAVSVSNGLQMLTVTNLGAHEFFRLRRVN
jgi:hypothetical protein